MGVTPLIFTQKTPWRTRLWVSSCTRGNGGSGPTEPVSGTSATGRGPKSSLFPILLAPRSRLDGLSGPPQVLRRSSTAPLTREAHRPVAHPGTRGTVASSPSPHARGVAVHMPTARLRSRSQRDLPKPDPVTAQQRLRNERSLCLPPSAYFLCPVNIEK